MGGFARILLEDYPDGSMPRARYLQIIQQEARRWGSSLTICWPWLAWAARNWLAGLDLAELAQVVFDELKAAYPERNLQIEVQPLPECWETG